MAATRDRPVKQGYLLVPLPLKKKWQKKYCVLYSFSNHRTERLEIYDSEDDANKRSNGKTITLDNCMKICLDPQKNQPYAFSITTKQATHLFACSNADDSHDWVCSCQGVAFRDTFSSTTIEEDNDLYCPSGDAGVFHVILVNTDASHRCGLALGDYTLVVAPEELQLLNPDTQNLLFTWPYRFIRRYGHKRGRFNFEAGRKCASGEGSFDFEHNNAQEIFKCITSKMDSMKQRLGGGGLPDKLTTMRSNCTGSVGSIGFLSMGSPDIGLPTCTSMDVDEGLAAAMTMSARSRSPLVSLSPSMTPINVTAVVPVSLAPMKPPRKNPPIPRYDHVEVRTEAWRTFGTNAAIHTERPPIIDRPAPPPPPSAVFIRSQSSSSTLNKDVSSHSDYDKLDHFGSTPKLDEDPSYSTILRQDSAGYGMIRKIQNPRHEVFNDFEYAMVFKTQASHKV